MQSFMYASDLDYPACRVEKAPEGNLVRGARIVKQVALEFVHSNVIPCMAVSPL